MRSLHRGKFVMKHLKLCGFIMALGLGSFGLSAAQQSSQQTVSVTRFSNIARVPVGGTAPIPLRLEVKDWALTGSGEVLQIPAQEFYIAELQSGSIITKIAGESEPRRAGEFWTVEAYQTMAVSLTQHCKDAHLRTIAIGPRG